MVPFDFQHRTRFVFGPGKVRELGAFAKELGCRRVLMVSDHGVVAAGHFQKGLQALEEAGLETASFHEFRENPNDEHVKFGVAVAQEFQPDLLVGLGGGSSMDCAKGINFVYSGGGRIQDYWGVGKATRPMLPMIAVPTTAGTGSEAQSFALISDSQTHSKMACGDPKAACRIAILDPELTLTQPARVTALTGVDALTHALETFVTKKRNGLSLVYSREAWRLLSRGFPLVLEDGTNVEARGWMQWGACLAGLAIETSMLGVAHATANPLTARYGTTHGQAVGVMMPHVIRWNGEHYSDWYHELWRETNRDGNLSGDSVESLATWMESMVARCGLETRLEDCGVAREDLAALPQEAVKQWTASFNPRPVSLDDARALYEAAW